MFSQVSFGPQEKWFWLLNELVGMEKQQKQELRWRVSASPVPAFHHVHSIQWNAGQTSSIQILVSVLFPYQHLQFVTSTRPMIYHKEGRASAP